MIRTTKRLTRAADSISRDEFLDALAQVCPAAVLSKHNGGLPLEIKTQILPIKLHESPMTATNVETFARKMRFQALGRACRDLGSSLLLLGHHYDDQAETLLMRMVDGHTAKLIGIQKIAYIPECHGLHGISGSGSHLTLQPSQLPRDCGVTGLERGGIKLGRPLLGFSKNRLLATCQKLNLPWFEDKTNKDRTLTSRNAVRHVVDKYRLPKALGSKFLIALGKRKRWNLVERERIVNTLFDEMSLTLDLRSGVVTAEFPKLDSASFPQSVPETPKHSSWDARSKQRHDTGYEPVYSAAPSSALIYYMLVKRIASMSYSGVVQTTGRFNDIVGSIYSISSGWTGSFYRPSNLKTKSSPKLHEASGLCFERIEDVDSDDVSMKWKIYRAPPKQSEVNFANAIPVPSRSFQRFAPTPELKCSQEDGFVLWDDRYWIRVHNPAKHDLWVRKLDEDSLASLRTLLSAGHVILRRQSDGEVIDDGRGYLSKLLRETAKGIIRWSLPVIVSYTPMKASTTRADAPLSTPQILAFPTLDMRLESASWPTWVNDLKWEVRYKRIDFGNKKLEDCLVGRDGVDTAGLGSSQAVKVMTRWESPLSGGKL
ncbi:hypothetical protein BLS_002585 [Venturia inaequalis]|uniref:tRNA(Ile)-lysidine/2-thiocytidine synthase N-terminal domain-containing protein n=1 Tax=Venturia inaequalis TaxID=5025 RepID=A0A8H3YVI5_VENIN|nr:hypothetical protein BLS_002585 [Venturia inaequalis]